MSSAEQVSGEGAAEESAAVDAVEDVNAAESSAAGEDGNTPESSDGERGAPKSTIEAVEAALRGEEESPASAEQDQNSEEESAAAEAEGEEKPEDEDDPFAGMSDEEIRKQPRDAKFRIHNLLKVKKTLETEMAAVKPKAESFDKITTFMKESRLSGQDVDNILHLGALVRNDPEKALTEITEKILPQLQAIVGHKLPEDLQKDVANGNITEARAREISQARARQARTEAQTREAQQAREAEERRRSTQDHVATIAKAADEWTSNQRKSDPDWAMKESFVNAGIENVVRRNGYPKDVAAFNKIADDVKKEVEKQLGRLRPRKEEIRPVESTSSGARSTPAPKSMLDVVDNALAGG